MNRASYHTEAGAYRAHIRKACAIGFHSAGVKLDPVAKPAGFDTASPDPLTTLATRRTKLLAALRADRAELARRDAERAEYRALGLDAPSCIVTDGLILDRMAAQRCQHLRAVRGSFMPLAVLSLHEGTMRVIQAWRLAA